MICSACGEECFAKSTDNLNKNYNAVSSCCGAEIINNPPTGGSGVPHKEFSVDAFQGCFHNYPTAGSVTGYPKSEMSLRDYFAAKAMQGLCACPDCVNFNSIASDSYKQADAMLKAREVK